MESSTETNIDRDPFSCISTTSNGFNNRLLDLHRALGFEDVWTSLQSLVEEVADHDTMVMSMNYLDWRREASAMRFTSAKSRVGASQQQSTHIAKEGRAFFQPYLQSNPGIDCYRHSEIIDRPDKLAETGFYKRCMQPLGWKYSAHLLIWREGNVNTSIALRRRPEQGDFSDREMDMLRTLHPHIQIALERVHAFEAEQQRRQILEGHYSKNPEAVMFMNWDGELMYASDECMIAACSWKYGPESARCYNHKKVFEIPESIATTCEDLRERWLAQAEGNDGKRPPLLMQADSPHDDQVAVVTLKHNGNGDLERPIFVVRITPKPSSISQISPGKEKLRLLLTPSERELAELVCQGLSNREIADKLHKAEGSVKVQLSAIYQKIGVKSRTQMALNFQ